MQKEVDNILVEIPEALPARVGEALSQVRAIHRRRVPVSYTHLLGLCWKKAWYFPWK